MVRANERRLIIVTGPVEVGKSSTSLALARSLRHPDVAVAVIDLDQMYSLVRQQDGYGEPAAWTRARQGAAALANAWFSTGVAVVIVEGEFFNAEELGALRAVVDASSACSFFTLRVSYDRALERVRGDPSRGASKDPAFLRSLHASFAAAVPFLEIESVVIDTDELGQDDVVALLIAAIREQKQRATG